VRRRIALREHPESVTAAFWSARCGVVCWSGSQRQAVGGGLPVQPPSSSGPGPRPFTAVARVRIPLGVLGSRSWIRPVRLPMQGPVAQLVSAPPCHGGGRGFKSRQGRAVRAGSRDRAGPALRPGSSVGTSVRLKSERSPVRSRPWPPRRPRQRRPLSTATHPSRPPHTPRAVSDSSARSSRAAQGQLLARPGRISLLLGLGSIGAVLNRLRSVSSALIC